MIDAHKIDPRYYKDSEYSGLFQFIFDIQKPKDLSFNTILKEMDNKALQEDAKYELTKFVRNGFSKDGPVSITPQYFLWKQWFLDKARFKDHELTD